jgi:hypothetical protein
VELISALLWASEHRDTWKPTNAVEVVKIVKAYRNRNGENRMPTEEEEEEQRIRDLVRNSLVILAGLPPEDRFPWIADNVEELRACRACWYDAQKMDGGAPRWVPPKVDWAKVCGVEDVKPPKTGGNDPLTCDHVEKWTRIGHGRERCPLCGSERASYDGPEIKED